VERQMYLQTAEIPNDIMIDVYAAIPARLAFRSPRRFPMLYRTVRRWNQQKAAGIPNGYGN
jgi:hypothetical protein